MKNETKLKIINWVKRLLNYKNPPKIVIDKLTLADIEFAYHMYPSDPEERSIHHYARKIADRIIKDDLIEIDRQKRADGLIHIHGRVLVVKPNRDE